MNRLARTAAITACSLTMACSAPADGPSPATSHAELTARTLMTVWESGDASEVAELFRPDAVYDDFSNQLQYRGIEEIAQYVGHVSRWATDLRIDVGAVHAGPAGATVEWLMSGIQDRPIPGVLGIATNREFFVNGVTVLELEDGLITRAADYIDVTPLLLQLGASISLPDGEVMSQEDIGGS